jgi:DNA helicase-2/ATP-dependent DNA helicase PcrA
MAILMRTNAQVAAFEMACRGAQVPYRLAGARPLLDDPGIQAMVRDLGRRKGELFEVVAADLAALARCREGDEPEGRPMAARTLTGLASEYERMENRPTVDSFLSWLGPATSSDRTDEGPPGVTISTFHRAKGLEWQAVWVTGLEEGLVPIIHARTDDAEAEERRLLYVALTRAGEELHCSWARERTFGERLVPRGPSPWLAAIAGPDSGHEPQVVTPEAQWRQRLAAQRDHLAGCRRPGSGLRGGPGAAADPGVVDALRAWRAGASRAAGVPAHVVLHDATLAAVAARQPQSTEDLLAVPGLGPVKVARYGSVLLDLVAAHRATA